MKPLSLYIHIPYCASRCTYCDFHSCAALPTDEYVTAVINRIPRRAFSTVYIGGGTPSLLSPEQLARLCGAVELAPGGEFTAEANPDSLSPRWLEVALEHGVNRLCLGVQSFDDDTLKIMGRRHTSKQAQSAIKLAHQSGFNNISFDIMLGLPKAEDIDVIAQFADSAGVTHLSCYMLKLEQGTKLERLYTEGGLQLPDDDEVAESYTRAVDGLSKYGYERYEISNFAKSGMHSRHNMCYWDCNDYIGIGPGAHGCVDGERFCFLPDTAAFVGGAQAIADGNCTAEDYIILQTRLASGLSLKALRHRFGVEFNARQKKLLAQLAKLGLLTFDGDTVMLTTEGMLIQNAVLTALL